MSLFLGAKLDGFEILAPLGSGGMGEVYRAHDPILKRDVAIKVLPASVAPNSDRLRRFEQEAQAAAALNHPNILAIYRFGVFDGSPYLVSELLEGETLRLLQTRGPLSVRKAIEIGAQIANGLAAAHEKGIVHRDLKPENLFITRDGRVKILDFGLAKLVQPLSTPSSHSPTLTVDTEPGVVLGTVGYMSPEQIRGRPSDHRSDIFSFGAVMYELLTGRRAFQRTSSVETMAAILNEDPPSISNVAQAAVPALERVVHRCLEKNPEQRFQSASDLAFALLALSESSGFSPSQETDVPRSARHRLRWAWISAAVLGIALAILYFVVKDNPSPPHVSGYTQITHSGKAGQVYGTDGVRLYLSQNRYGITEVATSGGDISPVKIDLPNPFLADVSPDGSKFLVFSLNAGTGPSQTFWSVNILGGAHQYLGSGVDASWSPDGNQIAYTTADGFLSLMKSDGTEAHKLAPIGGVAHDTSWSPDGKTIRFSEKGLLWEISSTGNNLRPLLSGWKGHVCCGGRWSPDGRFFYFNSEDQIFVHEERRSMLGRQTAPVQLTTGPIEWGSPIPSKDGTKLFIQGSIRHGELVRFDPQTKKFQPYLGGLSADGVEFSIDGQYISYVSYPDCILWKARRDGSERVQLSTPPVCPLQPKWSPDGSQILFVASSDADGPKAYLVTSQGGSAQRLIPDDKDLETDANWSADGTKVVFSNSRLGGKNPESVLKVFDLKSNAVSTIPGSTGMFAPRWSPDGHFIAAIHMDSIGMKVFDIKTQQWSSVYSGLLGYQLWSADSKHIYFLNFLENPAVFRVNIAGGPAERVIDLKDFRYTGIAGGWLGLDPSDAPLFLRDLSASDIYALTLASSK